MYHFRNASCHVLKFQVLAVNIREDILRLYENMYFSVHRPNVITCLNPQDNTSIQPIFSLTQTIFLATFLLIVLTYFPHPLYPRVFSLSPLSGGRCSALRGKKTRYFSVMTPNEGMSSSYIFNHLAEKLWFLLTKKRASMFFKAIHINRTGVSVRGMLLYE